MTTFTQQIKEQLLNGEQFQNELADWFTLNNPSRGLRIITIKGEDKFYQDINSYAKRVSQLIKRGY